MFYIDDSIIDQIPVNWEKLIDVIKEAVLLINKGDYSQPIKPYLRFNNLENRIIAMPAYVGGDINVAGIKWIASFPNNTKRDIPRAHSVVILNNSETGEPFAIFNSAKVSAWRTASVSGTIIAEYVNKYGVGLNIGIIGWGPIGHNHFKIINDYFAKYCNNVMIYDIKPIENIIKKIDDAKVNIIISDSWQKLYNSCDIIITCTVSKEPYIDLQPPNNALLLNVSLRDYKPSIYKWVKDTIVVDDWDEVCREGTDVEAMHKKYGLLKNDTINMYDVLYKKKMQEIQYKPIMFNPMGLAVFDMAIAKYIYLLLLQMGYKDNV